MPKRDPLRTGAAGRWRRTAPLVAAWVIAALLGGCASVGTPTREAAAPSPDIPARWSETPADEAAAAAVDRSWWRAFGDTQLDALVERALAANTEVRGAVAALAQARALVDVASAGLAPQVSASASAQRSRSGAAPWTDRFAAGFDASWELDLFGARGAGIDAARADAIAGAASLADVQVGIAAETALAYLQWLGARERLVVARRNLDTQLETLQITQWRTQAGLTTSLQLEQARAATEQTRAQIPLLEQSIAQNAHALALLTGRAPGALPELQAAAATTTPTAAERIALTIPADTLRARPDVRRAEAQWRAAAARALQAQRQRLPSVRLTGNIGLSALTLGALGGPGSSVAALLAGVSVPMFDGGALRAQARAQDAATERAVAAYQGTVLAALRDVEDALRALASAQERRATLQRAAEAAGNAALLAGQRYRGGLVDFQVVLDTQRTQLGAQDALAAAQTEVAAAQVRLYRSLGGGWSGIDDQSAALPAAPMNRTPR